MKWMDKPTEPGWYWAIEKNGDSKEIVYVLSEAWAKGYCGRREVEFFGPIPEPEDISAFPKDESKAITEILWKLREMRNEQNDPELRKLYNEVCDRLDVLDNKLFKRKI